LIKPDDKRYLRLGVNIDHVATVRNARGGTHPDPVRAAQLASDAGADSITAHLREDRRHIRDEDMYRLKAEIDLPLNFEMAATAEMLKLVTEIKPYACCLVPENRNERTTEGGLDVAGQHNFLVPFVDELQMVGTRVSLFIDPDKRQVDSAHSTGAPVIELHTGAYYEACLATDPKRIQHEFDLLKDAAIYADSIGLEVHAGHGLTFHNVQPIAGIDILKELNIGHFLVGESVFMGLSEAIKEMKRLMSDARTGSHY